MATATKNKAVSGNFPKRVHGVSSVISFSLLEKGAFETDSRTNLRASPSYMVNDISFYLTHYIRCLE